MCECENERVLTLRTATPDDAAAVARVHVRSWQAAYRGLLPDAYLDGLRPEDRMVRYTFGATDPSVPSTTVAVEDGVLCGFVTTRLSPDIDVDVSAQAEVLALYVDPDAWGLGVGRRLMADARTRLVTSGRGEAVLWVLVGNDRAQRFYRIDGWRPDGRRRTEEVWGVAVDEICYRRSLG
jgi:ribosomal protein S18 acetylase RimI-like enzyme